MHNPADMISQAEKRRILAEERRLSTYRAHAEANADLELGGRFAKVTTTTVTGASPISYPRQPADSPANQAALVGDERPLGYSVNDQECVGEFHEGGDVADGSDGATRPKSRLRRL
jgi:hypothetical protein